MSKIAHISRDVLPRHGFCEMGDWTDEELSNELENVTARFGDKRVHLINLIAEDNYIPSVAAEKAGYTKTSTAHATLKDGRTVIAIAVRREQLRRQTHIEKSWILRQYREVYDRAIEAGDINQQRQALADICKVTGHEPNAKLDVTHQVNHVAVPLSSTDYRQLAELNQLIEDNASVIEGSATRED